MRLLLLRHAVTTETGARLTGRLPGVALSEEGVAMAEALAARLAPLKLAALYTSPIERCAQTAEIVARGRSIAVSPTDALVETDFGRWSGRTLKSLYRLDGWRQLMMSASRFRFPDGETLREVQVRSVSAIEEMAVRHRHGIVLAVSHADVIRAALAHYLGTPLDMIHRLNVDPASVSAIDLAPDGAVAVPFVNVSGRLVAP
jgi:probable phosphomutase (TIGR03848 family)